MMNQSSARGWLARFGSIIGVLLALSALSSSIYVVYRIGRGVFFLPRELAVPLGAAFLTAVGSLIAVFLSKRSEQKHSIQLELRRQKIQVYEEFITFMFLIVFAEKTGRPVPSDADMIKFFADFTPKLLTWGSDDVVRMFTRFREISRVTQDDPTALFATVEDLLYAIRRDVGHDNKKLGRGDLLRMFVNDIGKYFERSAASGQK